MNKDPFHKRAFKKRSVCTITGRGVVEKPFLKTDGQGQH